MVRAMDPVSEPSSEGSVNHKTAHCPSGQFYGMKPISYIWIFSSKITAYKVAKDELSLASYNLFPGEERIVGWRLRQIIQDAAV